MSSVRTAVATVFLVAPVGVTFCNLFGFVSKVEGSSMKPSLNPTGQTSSDYVLLNRWKAHNFEFERGEVVSLSDPNYPDTKIIKRIVGLEGDTIKTLSYKQRYAEIPEGYCWIEGDNHRHSKDSNNFGPVPLGLIYAKATHIVWPPRRWQKLTVKTDSSRVNSEQVLPSHITKQL